MKTSRILPALLAIVLASSLNISLGADVAARRKVIIDQDAFGPAGSNMQAILIILASLVRRAETSRTRAMQEPRARPKRDVVAP